MRVQEWKKINKQNLCLAWLSLGFFLIQTLMGCANKPTPRERMEQKNANAHPHPAVWSTESFYLHHRSPPEKEVEKWEFYFKHCRLVDRNPFPTHDEYTCSEPY